MSVTPRKDVFQQAARCILHPITLVSMFLLFLNDYILRVYTPSWITGKLGDFSWLFFFPYLVTAIIAWALPKRWTGKNTPILISIGFTILLFTLGKVWPAFLQGLHTLMEWFLPWNVRGVIDPTDLAALVVLPVTFWLWKRCEEPKVKQAQWSLSKKSAAILCLSIAIVLTVGSQIIYRYGAQCATFYNDLVYIEADSIYQIRDGGKWSWDVSRIYDADTIFGDGSCDPLFPSNDDQGIATLVDPRDDSIRYRIYQNEKIERSTDAGETWKIDYIFEPWTQAQIKYNQNQSNCSSYDQIGPFDAVFDGSYNNLILTMGCRGLLVRNNFTNKYSYESLGNYSYKPLEIGDISSDVLGYRGIQIIILAGLLSFSTFRLLLPVKRNVILILFILNISLLVLSILIFLPSVHFPPFDILGMFINLLVLFPISLILVLMVLINFIRLGHIHWLMVAGGILCTITFLVFFLLWAYNIIPEFLIAAAIASVVSILITIACHLVYRKIHPQIDEALENALSGENEE